MATKPKVAEKAVPQKSLCTLQCEALTDRLHLCPNPRRVKRPSLDPEGGLLARIAFVVANRRGRQTSRLQLSCILNLASY